MTTADPYTTVSAPVIAAALADVNTIRLARGAPPLDRMPWGRPCHGMLCPLAQALSDVFPGRTVFVGMSIRTRHLTGDYADTIVQMTTVAMRRFETEFDGYIT